MERWSGLCAPHPWWQCGVRCRHTPTLFCRHPIDLPLFASVQLLLIVGSVVGRG